MNTEETLPEGPIWLQIKETLDLIDKLSELIDHVTGKNPNITIHSPIEEITDAADDFYAQIIIESQSKDAVY